MKLIKVKTQKVTGSLTKSKSQTLVNRLAKFHVHAMVVSHELQFDGEAKTCWDHTVFVYAIDDATTMEDLQKAKKHIDHVLDYDFMKACGCKFEGFMFNNDVIDKVLT